jgi:beta-lactamase regulating signal transducer with metallopeptidase domain/protocatechuate 3,4-dioxygenase beta subunit
MNTILDGFVHTADQLWFPWLEVMAKSSGILVLAFALNYILKRRHPLTCSAIWNATIVGLLILPIGILAGPRLPVWIPQPRERAIINSTGADGSMVREYAMSASSLTAPGSENTSPREQAGSIGRLDSATSAAFPGQSAVPIRALLILAIGLGMLGAMARWIVAVFAIHRLRGGANSVTNRVWLESLSRWSTQLDVRQAVSIKQTVAVNVPIVVGIFHPTIILPRSLAERPEPTHVDAIVTHELAHVRRRDYAWQLWWRFLQGIYWYQPLIWLAESEVSANRERACDEFAINAIGSSERYATTLFAMAERMVQRTGMSLGIAVVRAPRIIRRLQAIKSSKGDRECNLPKYARAVFLSVGVLIAFAVASASIGHARAENERTEAATARAAPNTDEANIQKKSIQAKSRTAKASAGAAKNNLSGAFEGLGPNVVIGRAVDEKGQSIAGAHVFLFRINQKDGARKLLGQKTTDADGRFRFDNVLDIDKEFPGRRFPQSYLADDEMLEGFVRTPSRITYSWLLSRAVVAQMGHYELVKMLPAATLSGRVTDTNGKPIAGALVSIDARARNGWVNGWEGAQSSRTNANGKYKIDDAAPFDEAEFEKQVAEDERRIKEEESRGIQTWRSFRRRPLLTVEHLDYAVKHTSFDKSPGTKDVQLDAAANLAGRVIFADSGKPAAGVLVGAATSIVGRPKPTPALLQDFQRVVVRTDANGKYRIASLPAGKYEIWAAAPGWVNEGVNDVVASAGKTESAPDLTFTKGGVVSARLVDAKTGQPITVQAETRTMILVRPPVGSRLSLRPEESPFILANPAGRFEVKLRPGKSMIGAGGVEIGGKLRFSGQPAAEVTVIDGQTVDVDLPVIELE